MKKISLLFTLALCVGLAHGQVVTETFDYAVGTALKGAGAAGAGWDGPWVFPKGEDGRIAAGSITAAGRTSATGHFRIDNNQSGSIQESRYYRKLSTPRTDVAGQVAWLSQYQQSIYDGESASNGTVHFMGFANAAAYTANGPGGQLMFFGRQFNNANVAAVRIPTNAVISDKPANEMNFIVSALYWSGDAAAERLYVWINPSATAPALDTATADIKRLAPDLNGGFDAIGGKVAGGGGMVGLVDDIRLGSSYADVRAAGGPVQPSGKLATESFDYAAGAALAGLGTSANGWGGAWMKLSTADGYVISPEMVYSTALGKQTTATSLRIDKPAGADVRYVRKLSQRFADEAGKVYYLSSFQRHTDLGGSYVLFADSDTYGASGANGQLIMTGTNPGQGGFGVSRPPANNQNGGPASTEDGALTVTAVYLSGDAANDKVYVWFNPDLAAATLDTAAADLKVYNVNFNGGFDAVGLKATGGAVVSMIDEIVVGTAYADVKPGSLTDYSPPVTLTGIAVEKFNYTAGESLVGKGDASQGWKGPWALSSDSKDSTFIRNRSLPISDLNVITSAPSVEFITTGNNQRLQRLFETPLTPAGGDFWFANQLAVDGNLNTVANLTLINLDTMGKRAFERVFVGKQFGSRNIFAAGVSRTGPAQTGKTFNGSEASWIVSRMVVTNADSSEWKLYVWVNPNPAVEPDTALADIKGKPYREARFDGVWLKVEANRGFRASFDDVYFGRTFAQVLPDDLMSIPAAGLPAEDGFTYPAGTPLEGKAGGTGWAAAWENLGGTGTATIAEGGVRSLPLLKSTVSGHTALTNAISVRRKLNAEYGDYGRSYWLGYWTVSEGAFAGNVSRLVLATSAFDGGANSASGELVQIGKGFGADNLGFAGGAAAPGVLASAGHFVAVEVVTNGTSAPDDIYVWVDPNQETRPSRDSAIAQQKNLAGWEYVGLKVAGTDGLTTRFDDIYTGTTFAAIVPTDLVAVADPGKPIAAVEVFDYPAGTMLNTLDGGTGWKGPWAVTGAGSATIVAGSLVSPRVNTAGNSVKLSGTTQPTAAVRPLFSPFGAPNADSATVWVSFLLQQPAKAIGTAGSVGIGSGDNVIAIGSRQGASTLNVTINGADPQPLAGTNTTDANWVVMRFQLSGNDNPEQVRMWINPASDAIPSNVAAVYTNTSLTGFNAGLERVVAEILGTGTIDLRADEFRIGFSYRDISTQFGSSNPNLQAFEPFNYDAGTTLVGKGGENAFWKDAWAPGTDAGPLTTNTLDVTAGSIAGPSGLSTSGNKVRANLADGAQKIRVQRTLAEPIKVENGNVTWVSFLMNTTAPDFFGNVSLVTLISDAGPYPNGGEAIGFGRGFGATAGPLSIVFPGNGGAVVTEVADVGTHLITARILSRPDSTTDLISLWVDPQLGSTPDTSTAELNLRRDRLRLANITAVRLKVEGGAASSGYVTEFDEIRIAKDFLSSIGTSALREPLVNDKLSVTAYPNPVGSELRIDWIGEASGQAEITVMDLQGRQVAQVLREPRAQGENSTVWYPSGDMANGIYYLVVRHGNASSVRKLVMIR